MGGALGGHCQLGIALVDTIEWVVSLGDTIKWVVS